MGVRAAGDAAAALDALGRIAHERRCEIVGVARRLLALEDIDADAGQARCMQEFAETVLAALLAVRIVIGQQQLDAATARW